MIKILLLKFITISKKTKKLLKILLSNSYRIFFKYIKNTNRHLNLLVLI